ncbi:hypothetical protein OHA21_15185 [Actinoplanes sp. NBC_00393]
MPAGTIGVQQSPGHTAVRTRHPAQIDHQGPRPDTDDRVDQTPAQLRHVGPVHRADDAGDHTVTLDRVGAHPNIAARRPARPAQIAAQPVETRAEQTAHGHLRRTHRCRDLRLAPAAEEIPVDHPFLSRRQLLHQGAYREPVVGALQRRIHGAQRILSLEAIPLAAGLVQ